MRERERVSERVRERERERERESELPYTKLVPFKQVETTFFFALPFPT